MEIRTKETKEGRVAIELADLIECYLYRMSNPDERKDLIERFVANPQFKDAVLSVIDGLSDNEWSSYDNGENSKSCDSLRLALVESAQHASLPLIANLMQTLDGMRRKLIDAENHKKEILKLWPSGFEKYIPKEMLTYSYKYFTEDDARKLLDSFLATPEPPKEQL